MKLINPLEEIGTELCAVQNPSRYLGGEVGAIIKAHENDGEESKYNFAIAFPDLYEIAMCNQAVKIIYNGLNRSENIRCERVFAPDTDFEALLKAKNIPLYTLETGMALKDVDMIGFSIGYELGITSVLAMLEAGGVPLLACDRSESDPIVFAGGCGVTNPAPFSDFFDAVFIGEAEDDLFSLVEELSLMKKSGKSRSELLSHFARSPHVWTRDMSMEKTAHVVATRALQADFGQKEAVSACEREDGAGPRNCGDYARLPERLPLLSCRHLLSPAANEESQVHFQRGRQPCQKSGLQANQPDVAFVSGLRGNRQSVGRAQQKIQRRERQLPASLSQGQQHVAAAFGKTFRSAKGRAYVRGGNT